MEIKAIYTGNNSIMVQLSYKNHFEVLKAKDAIPYLNKLLAQLPEPEEPGKMSPVKIYCMHCGNLTYKTPRDEAHLEELLRYPVGECPTCELKITLMTDEEVRQHLAECDQEHKDKWEEAKRLRETPEPAPSTGD